MLKNIVSILIAATVVVASTSSMITATRASGSGDISMADAKVEGTGIDATFEFIPAEDKTGLQMVISASGLKNGILYPYHIHTNVVPSDGNCTGTGGHLDPFEIKSKAGTSYKCDKTKAQSTCELGDLAGMFGNMTAGANGKFSLRVSDSILTFSGSNAILGHSIVIHGPDNARLACANITGYVVTSSASANEKSDKSSTSGASSVAVAGALAIMAAALAI
ncbi:Superoxide dismutase [Kickxella alabastrina]|uniref:Superoxide dismutase n=1 Tax=Kickxella alabastrina TaxID=61397 RepID=A0ACC1IRU2_9FUNG|nr:Superoxide dismutase [Kickxella alabastrina]